MQARNAAHRTETIPRAPGTKVVRLGSCARHCFARGSGILLLVLKALDSLI
jgi:hypothetical protein